MSFAAQNAASAATQVMNSPMQAGGSVGGELSRQKDAKEAATGEQFGDLLKNIQAKYGAKAEKPREIKKTLGKDDFLKIMVTQMKFQDPTSPFKPDQMAAQMAQFASVEQLQNLNSNFTKMSQANQPMERIAMTNMIGKTVTVDTGRFMHKEGENEVLPINLPRDAKEVRIAVIADTGETIFTKDIGPTKAGEASAQWDGLKTNSLPAKSGNYVLRIEAKDDKMVPIQMESSKKARVVGVSFEGSEPILLIGDNKRQEKMPVRSVIRIDADYDMPVAKTSAQVSAPVQQPSEAKQNFFTFQKGVGSANMDSASIPPEAAAAIARYNNAANPDQAENSVEPKTDSTANESQKSAQNDEKGFPNGLNELKD